MTTRNRSKRPGDHSPAGNLQGHDEKNPNSTVLRRNPVSDSVAILQQRNVEESSTTCAFSGKEEDTDESDWEDGDIPIADSTNSCSDKLLKEVIVEFSDCRSTKRKPSRRISAEDKELAKLVHKVHLLCLLARGRLVDRASSDPLIQAALLSLLPACLLKTVENSKLTANGLAPIVKWFHNIFHVGSKSIPERPCKLNLASALQNQGGTSEEVAALSVALFRALNLTTRYVSVLDVASLKPNIDVHEGSSQRDGAGSGIFRSSTLMVSTSNQGSPTHSYEIKGNNVTSKSGQPTSVPAATQLSDKMLDQSAQRASSHNPEARSTSKGEGSKRKGDLEFELQLEMALAATEAGVRGGLGSEMKDLPSGSSQPSFSLRGAKRIKSEGSPVSNQGISTALGSKKVGAPLCWAEVFCSGQNMTGKWVHVDAINAIIDGEQKVEAGIAACRKSLRYVVAFAGTGAKDVTRRYCMKWYKIASKRIDSNWWDAVLAPLKELESAATGGTDHVGANSGNDLKELEKVNALTKYSFTDPNVMGTANSSLTQACLDQVVGPESKLHGSIMDMESSSLSSRVATRNSLEDMDLQTRALTEPLPTNQQAYRTHHLYAIEKWLGKYQILYPKGPVLGFCSGHPVYPRSCVQTLLTKQRWLREGLQIKSSESPARIVKRSSKVSKSQTDEPGAYEEGEGEGGGEGTVAVYGKWQTEPIDLPHAVNGVVPRNERGQVDVWSEKCLPHGTVHIRLPRVVSVAKRLCIDFAPAMVGFEFRNGRSFPVFEGIVVCTEFKDAILEAYAEEEERREAEEKKRNEAQALSRWYQLLLSILTRDRLNKTYGDGSSSQTTLHNRENAVSGMQITNPRNDKLARKNVSGQNSTRLDLPLRGFSEDHEHVFPAEDQSFDEESSVRTKRCPCGFSVQVEEL